MSIIIVVAVSCICIVLQSHEEESKIRKISNKKLDGQSLNTNEIKFLNDYSLNTLNNLQKIKSIAKTNKS